MTNTLKNLALALLNATLLLLALCLFLGWKVSSNMNSLTATFAENLHVVAPLRDDIREIRGEMAGLRNDLSELKSAGGDISKDAVARLESRVAALSARFETVGDQVTELTEAPEKLLDYAIETSADAMARGANALRGCTPMS